MKISSLKIVIFLFVFVVVTPLLMGQAGVDSIKIISWNVQGKGSDPALIARQIEGFHGVDIWGLCEVEESSKDRFITAAAVGENQRFKGILSQHGRDNRLLIIFNTDKFDLVESIELKAISFKNRGRPMLLAKLREKKSNSQFFFGVNHLFRTIKQKRQEQSRKINLWVRGRDLPIILVGDYNYDYEFSDDPVDFDKGLNDLRYFDDDLKIRQILYWVRPVTLVRTQSSVKYRRVLDFIFVNKKARQWHWQSVIIVKKGDFPDDRKTSDHRPLEGRFRIE